MKNFKTASGFTANVDHEGKILRISAVSELVGGPISVDEDGKGNAVITYHAEQTPVSDAKIDTKLAEMQAEYDAKQYQRDRQYPELREQLDMLFHDMTASKGDKTGEWYKAVAKVKADNPKE